MSAERMIRAGFPPTKEFGGASLVTTDPAATTEFSPTVTPPMIVAPAAIQTFLSITMGLPIVTFRRCEGSRGWPAVMMLTFGPIITSSPMSRPPRAILIYEDIMPDADFVTAGSVEWRDQQEAVVYFFTDEFAEQGSDFVRIIERQTVKSGGDRHRSFDICEHGR